MLFSSMTFIFIFLPIVTVGYYVTPYRYKNLVMLLASLLFCAWGEPLYLALLVLLILFHYCSGIAIVKTQAAGGSGKGPLVFGIVFTLLVLGVFRYFGFLLETINTLFLTDISYRELSFPLGLSIYALHAMAYLLDVYRGRVEPCEHVLELALYLCMFPQMWAGPISCPAEMQAQIQRRTHSVEKASSGCLLFLLGLAKKGILANRMLEIHQQVASQTIGSYAVLTAWLGCIAYAFWIYFALSGYADMARGLGKLFGFELRENFHHPYAAVGITDFCRRWNSTLLAWFHEYVYIPLGGNRCGRARHIGNILLVWGLTGFWYGAQWRYLLWGLYMGGLLVGERYGFRSLRKRWPGFAQRIYTWVLLLFGWTFFFSENVPQAFAYLSRMIGIHASGFLETNTLYLLTSNWLVFLLCVLFMFPASGQVFTGLALPGRWKERLAAVLSLLYGVSVVGLVIAGIFLPDQTYSLGEERTLASRPTLTVSSFLSGEFGEEYETYLSDQYVGRSAVRICNSLFSRIGGSREEYGVFIGTENQLLEKAEGTQEEQVNENIDALKNFATTHEDLPTYVLMVPNAADVLTDKLPALAAVNHQTSVLTQMKKILGDSVAWIDAGEVLGEHAQENIYYKTDKHWTSTGAFYVFQAAADTLGIDKEALSTYVSYPISADFTGMLAVKSGARLGYQETIDIYVSKSADNELVAHYVDEQRKTTSLYDSSKLEEQNQYQVFLGGDTSVIDIKTITTSTRRLLVIKDSYANCFIPFLTPYFREIVVVDPAYYSGTIEEIMDTYRITETLVLYGSNSFFQDNHISGVLGSE